MVNKTMSPSLKYFLRYCFTWLIEFWLRPLDILAEIKQKKVGVIAYVTMVVNGLLFGCLFGLAFWQKTGDFSGAIAVLGAISVAVSVTGTFASAFAVVVKVVIKVRATSAGGALIGEYAVASAGVIVVGYLSSISITDKLIIYYICFFSILNIFFSILYLSTKNIPDWLRNILAINWFFYA